MENDLTDFVFPSFTDVYKFIMKDGKKIKGELEFKHHCITFRKTPVHLPNDDGFKDDDDDYEDDDDEGGDMDITYSSIKKATWMNCDGTKGLELEYINGGCSTDFGGFKIEDYASVKNALKTAHQIDLVKENLFVGFTVKKVRLHGNLLELIGNGDDVMRYNLSENTSGYVDVASEDPPKELVVGLGPRGTFILRTLKF